MSNADPLYVPFQNAATEIRYRETNVTTDLTRATEAMDALAAAIQAELDAENFDLAESYSMEFINLYQRMRKLS